VAWALVESAPNDGPNFVIAAALQMRKLTAVRVHGLPTNEIDLPPD
jgi:hypothetical protein